MNSWFSKNKTICLISIPLILTLFMFTIGFAFSLETKLPEFTIKSVEDTANGLKIEIEKIRTVVSYQVQIYNEENTLIKEQTSTESTLLIENLSLDYQEKVTVKATIKNENNEVRESENTLTYQNTNPAFRKEKIYFSKNENVSFEILGDYENLTYEIYDLGEKIKEEKVSASLIILENNFFKSGHMKYEIDLKKEGKLLHTMNFYIGAPIIGNINVKNYKEESPWDDLTISYEGGTNATEIQVELIEENGFSKSLVYDNEGTLTISADYLKENTRYTIYLRAIYKDYKELSKFDSFTVQITEKQYTEPVYVNTNYKNVKKGSIIELKSRTPNANIYFTTDGSIPTKESFLYQNPMMIDEDVTIKAIAVSNNHYDSEVNTYDFHIGEKQLVVYLSPSNQYANYGVKSVGYSTEKIMMNKLTDKIVKILKEHNVVVYRNNPSAHLNDWNAESNYVKADLHLAIHSNGSVLHDTKGMEIYVDKPTSPSLSIASNLYENLYAIYPNKDATTDRGVKFAQGSLGEANDSYVRNGTLIEIAYHDDYEDALWIVSKMDEIAENLASTILEFYQVS